MASYQSAATFYEVGFNHFFRAPNEKDKGDLIYYPLTEDTYEIKYVEREQPFFQLGKQYFYILTAELYEQGADKFDTGIDEIDDIERWLQEYSEKRIYPQLQ